MAALAYLYTVKKSSGARYILLDLGFQLLNAVKLDLRTQTLVKFNANRFAVKVSDVIDDMRFGCDVIGLVDGWADSDICYADTFSTVIEIDAGGINAECRDQNVFSKAHVDGWGADGPPKLIAVTDDIRENMRVTEKFISLLNVARCDQLPDIG